MRSRTLAALGATAIAVGGLGAAAQAAGTTHHYTGGAGPSDSYKMSFTVSGTHVQHFTFQSKCPGMAAGVTVPHKIAIKHGKFSYHDSQFTIHGSFIAHNRAKGTERDKTGDCDSGTLTWSARTGG